MNKYNINMSKPYPSGYLEVIIGPMFSSKTSKLVEIYKQCKFCNISVAVINHSIDNRYDEMLLSTHDKIKIPCVKTENLKDIWTNNKYGEDIKNANVILINEGQFFPDLYEVVVDMLENGKQVYVCGLDGDFERKPFGNWLDLVLFCDSITKLSSKCGLCKIKIGRAHV